MAGNPIARVLTRSTQIATIANTANDSNEIALVGGSSLLGIFIPAEFDGTQIGFKVKDPTGTFVTMQVDGADYVLTVAPSKYVPVEANYFVGIDTLKISAVTAQTGASNLYVVKRAVS